MPAAVAIKISADLAESARAEASHADRSLTGQIEHWAKLGRVFETLVPAQVATALKRTGGDIGALEDPAMRQRALAAIEAVHDQTHFQKTSANLLKAGGTRYETDPANPRGIVQVQPDGSRVRGSFVGRTFVPAQT